jgi:hypothetical protein
MVQRLGLGPWFYAHLAGEHVCTQAILAAHPVAVTQGGVDQHQSSVRTFVQWIQHHQLLSEGLRLQVFAPVEELIHQSLEHTHNPLFQGVALEKEPLVKGRAIGQLQTFQ